LDRVCNGIISLHDEGKVDYFVGNYFYYKEKHEELIREISIKNKPAEAKPKKQSIVQKKKLSWKEEKMSKVGALISRPCNQRDR